MSQAAQKIDAPDTPHPNRGADGILPSAAIADMIAQGQITASHDFADNQIQPASLDLRLGATAYRLRASFLPGATAVRDKLAQMSYHQIDLSGDGAVLERGCVYLVPLMETLALPPTIAALANPKSSTGRIDVFARVITEKGVSFDAIPAGYKGALYLEVSPRSFSILVRAGSRLAQLRLRRGVIESNDVALHALHAKTPLVDGTAHIQNGLALSVDLKNTAQEIIGYRAQRHAGLIDVDAAEALAWRDFWQPIHADSDFLILDPDAFYILASCEAVRIPPTHAAEMVPFDPMVGEFRVHYAGFFDPGFGCDAPGFGCDAPGFGRDAPENTTENKGARAVLEVRSRDVPFVLEHGQIIGRLLYERLASPSTMLYGAALGSHYQSQGLRLSKHFIQDA